MAEQVKHPLPFPLLLPTLCWCIGIGLAAYFRLPAIWLTGIAVAVIAAALVFKFRLPFVILLVILAGFIRLSISVSRPESAFVRSVRQRESITNVVSGKILKVLRAEQGMYLTAIDSVGQLPIREKALMIHKEELLPGDRFRAHVLLTATRADPVLDAKSFYWKQRSTRTPLSIRQVYKLEKQPSQSPFNIERIRYKLLQQTDIKLGDSAPFAKALLLNDRTEDKDWIEQLVKGGLLHLIAISGLHVLFFYFVFVTLLNIFISRKISELIFVLLMLFYAGLCQWSAPVMRAIIMILLYLFAKWLQRPASPLQIICFSLLIITIIDPLQLFSVGLQLSYLCVLTLVFVVPHRIPIEAGVSAVKRRLNQFRNLLLDTLIVSTIVSVVMLPIMLFYFYRGSLNGIVGNLLGIPLVALLLPLTFVLILLPANWLLYDWLKAGFDILHLIFQKWVEWTAGLPLYLDTVALPFAMLIAAYLVITGLTLRFRAGEKHKGLSYAILLLAIPFFIYSLLPVRRDFTITAFNAGMGDCILVSYPDGQNLMIDTGPRIVNHTTGKASSWFGNRTNIWQKQNRIDKIDLLVLTHLHDDHAGGLEEVFRMMKVRNLMLTKHSAKTTEWQNLMQSGLLKEADIKVIDDTLSFQFAGSHVSILHPNQYYKSSDENDLSIVMRIDYKGYSSLFTGDISKDVELRLLQEIPDKLDTDFLKVPHHGSRHSSSMTFIRAVSPQQVCITASRRNRFHFPHQETMRRYRSYGVEPQITGNGSVVMTIR